MKNNPKSQRIRYSFLKILTGSDLSTRRLALMEVKSCNPGPVIWLTGCSHGDELGGIVVIQEIFKKIKKSILLKGSIYAFPLMNPMGFETASRNITLSKEDLNRAFPGKKDGSLAERIAYKIFSTIIETKPTVVMDLHNDWTKSIPYTLIDPPGVMKNILIYNQIIQIAKKTGFLMVNDQYGSYHSNGIDKTLSLNLIQKNIPSLTLELGESFVVNEKNVELGVNAIMNILSHYGMIYPLNGTFYYPIQENLRSSILEYSNKPVSSTSGIIRFLVKPGDILEKNQPIGRIYNAFGKLRETLRASNKSVVLGYSDSSVVFPGIPVMAFGIIPD